MGKLTLSDKFFVEGKELEDFENILKQIDDSTEFLRISGGNIGFAYYLNASFMKEAYKVLLITQKELLSFEQGLLNFKVSETNMYPVPSIGYISKQNVNEQLCEESFDTAGYLTYLNGYVTYISGGALSSLMTRSGICGEQSSKKSIFLTQAMCEALTKTNPRVTVVTRKMLNEEGRYDRKIFAFLSEKYIPIPQRTIIRAIKALLKDGKFGSSEINRWYVDHDFTSIHIEFPEAGEEFSDISGLKDTVVPGLVLMSSDTGKSSFIIRGTYRLKGCNRYVIVDEYARKHIGTITSEEILTDCDREIMVNFRKLPEELARKMGQLIGNGHLVEKALRDSLIKLGIRKIIGKTRFAQLLEQLNAEIDQAAIYSEYDVAILIMGLADRLEGLPKFLLQPVAKATGRAPFITLSGNDEDNEELILMPEEESE